MPPYRLVTGPATQQRIRATLRTALNGAVKRQLITFNPASLVELASGKRPKAVLWTEQHVQHWRETGDKPSAVMVWRPDQNGAFLDEAEADRLYAFFRLIAFRGLRRGEGVGLDWVNVDLEAHPLSVAKEIVVDGRTPVEDVPRTDGSAATIALDSVNVAVLREHRARRLKVLTAELGEWLHPEKVWDAFRRICRAADLPPINLRDLRHCAATLIHAGGGDLHAIKETLRHFTITLAGETYTSLLLEADLEIAEARGRPRAPGQEGSCSRDGND
nr:site-specific integrase [Actinacidiphila glaucinigra]